MTDEQLAKSRGRVRCGTCNERFKVNILPDNISNNDSADDPRFDIENIKSDIDSIHDYDGVGDDVAEGFAKADTQANIDVLTSSTGDLFDGLEANSQQDTQLLDEVDQLIEEKVLSPSIGPTTYRLDNTASIAELEGLEGTDKNTITAGANSREGQTDLPDFLSDVSAARSRSNTGRTVALTGLSLLALALLVGLFVQSLLTYDLGERFAPLVNVVNQQLNRQPDNKTALTQLKLISARTRPHQSRSSTTLLQVNLMNQSEKDQRLPWLELTLTDKDERVIARRSLPPANYIHNNATDVVIERKEVKSLTVELLDFPKQAYGYQVRIIDHK